jgi:hypothetical protein
MTGVAGAAKAAVPGIRCQYKDMTAARRDRIGSTVRVLRVLGSSRLDAP